MNKKAFTLVELAVVLLVIGILAGLLLRNLGGFTSAARDQRRIGDLRNVSSLITTYYVRRGQYPTATTWSNLEQALKDAGVLTPGTRLPNDPTAPTISYKYSYCTSTSSGRITNYVLKAQLESNRQQAPDLFKDSITYTDISNAGLSCPGITASECSSTGASSDYCLLF